MLAPSSPAIENGNIFLVLRGDIDERLDAIYNSAFTNLAMVTQTTFQVVKLASLCFMQRGKFSFRPRNDPRFYGGEYPFIQTGDIVKANESFDQISYSQTLNDLGLSVSKLFDFKTILITIAANIGDTAILDYPACFPDSIVALTPKSSNLEIEYLNIYFKYIKKYLSEIAPQSAQKNINLQQLAPTPIIVPPKEIQFRIISIFQKAYSLGKEKRLQASSLINSIEVTVQKKLDIEKTIGSDRKKVFRICSKSLFDRLDPSPYQSNFFFHSSHWRNVKLSSIAWIDPRTDLLQFEEDAEISFVPMEAIDESRGEVTKKYMKSVGGSKGYTKFKENDLLWAKITPCMQNGKSAIARGLVNGHGFGSTEFFVIRPRTPDILGSV